MEIEDQKQTYDGFIKWSVRSTVVIVAVMLFLAAFVA